MQLTSTPRLAPLAAALAALTLSACGGGDPTIPPVPAGVGRADTAPVPDPAAIPPYVDNAATNQRNNPCNVTRETNAGVRVLAGLLDLWTPSSLRVDAGVTLAAANGCAAVVPSSWTGIPGDATDGKVVNASVLDANVKYVVDATASRTTEQAVAAYVDDRRGKGYSVTDGLGPLTAAWRTAAQQTTTITGVPADATTVKYDDGGNNTGVGGASNPAFGAVVDFVNGLSNNGSTEPAKRFYKYARPWRWSSSVVVVPELVPAKSGTPATDGGFPSGHTAEAVRDALAMAYVVPERFQELVARALELGENRILAGMHSPLDVMAGRIQAQAVVTANLAATPPAARKAAHDQAHAVLMAAAGTADEAAFEAHAHSGTLATDRFADQAKNRTEHAARMTYGFAPIADSTRGALVPKGAELLLETRLPYLSDEQRRVVLKTTALSSGYPLLDDAEGWGRLDLFAAADGYGAFLGDVSVTMDASLGGFCASDAWRNDISGPGKLTKSGTGTLRLGGDNGYGGGTQVEGGVLVAESATAFGTGDVYVSAGAVVSGAAAPVQVGGNYTQRAGGTLRLLLGSGGAGRLVVSKTATLDGGALAVEFAGGYRPAVGDVLNVVTAAVRQGTFASVTVDGFKATASYTPTGVQLRIDP